jgi:hypothetical protein
MAYNGHSFMQVSFKFLRAAAPDRAFNFGIKGFG